MNDEAPRVELPARSLFRFAVPCRYQAGLDRKAAWQLSAQHALPNLATLEDRRAFAEVRLGWNDAGLAIEVHTHGKRRAPQCKPSDLEGSDGLRVWINTRHNPDVRRGTRFCHQFVVLPFGRGRQSREPVLEQVALARTREQAPASGAGLITARSESRGHDYSLWVFLDAAALQGWAPREVGRLGFNYRMWDHEFGEQTLSLGDFFPIAEDPSLWALVECVE